MSLYHDTEMLLAKQTSKSFNISVYIYDTNRDIWLIININKKIDAY